MTLIGAIPLALLALQTPVSNTAQPAPDARFVASAQRATTAPVIDGRDDDEVWRLAEKTADFRQWDPVEDAEPSFRTEFQVAYDADNLYVYVRAYDPYPDSIMRALSRRDLRGPSDQIVVFVDAYNDRRTGFEFAINPHGVKRDYAV